jgi:hypothetical protein
MKKLNFNLVIIFLFCAAFSAYGQEGLKDFEKNT